MNKKTGFTKENKVNVLIKRASDRPLDFVSVKITDKTGHNWEVEGEAGMVSIHRGTQTEVDFVGTAEEIELLLATCMVKVTELISPLVVERAMLRYKERIIK